MLGTILRQISKSSLFNQIVYTNYLTNDWDPIKAASNFVKHGVRFESAIDFDWATALVLATFNHQTGEPRMVAFGFIGHRMHAMAFSVEERGFRLINLRRANNREQRFYEGRQKL